VQVMLVDKDVRRMSVKPKPDGTPPDLARPADILIYEARFAAPSAVHAAGHTLRLVLTPIRNTATLTLSMRRCSDCMPAPPDSLGVCGL
jgi:hypothetical protein